MKIEPPYGTTKKGNKYKKSNITAPVIISGFFGGLVTSLAADIFVKHTSDTNKLNKVIQAIKKSSKAKYCYVVGSIALPISTLIADFIIDKKRAKAADEANS